METSVSSVLNTLCESLMMMMMKKKFLSCPTPRGYRYNEKFYFSPGDTGFKVWNTKYAKIGVGICWDQWFPEASRSMALQGAEILFYPTAIGSEPMFPDLDSREHWRRVIQVQTHVVTASNNLCSSSAFWFLEEEIKINSNELWS